MGRTLTWHHGGLLLRLAVAWYLVQGLGMVVLATLVGGFVGVFGPVSAVPAQERLVLATEVGLMAGFMGGILLFPYSSALLALAGTFLQWRSGGPAASGHRVDIQVPWTAEEARTVLDAVLQALGSEAVEARGALLHARFRPFGRGWLRRLRTDEATVMVGDGTLEVRMRPASGLWHLLWVDRGRNHERLARLQRLVADRLAAERRAAQEAHRVDAQAARLAQAELLLLRAQVEPHFLFNTLAHLRELIRTGDAPAALAMVDALVAHARAATERIHRVSHPLGEERASTEAYLDLMQLRFGQRLSYTVCVPNELLDVDVPVGTLLIPVENAVKHGLEPKPGGGTIAVVAGREGDCLLLDILDDGVGLGPEPPRGTGLANLRQRLRLAHGEMARLTVEGRETGGVHVRIRLPIA